MSEVESHDEAVVQTAAHRQPDQVKTYATGTEKEAMCNKSIPRVDGKPRKSPKHPKYSQMIRQAITKINERKGSSRQAILSYIMQNFEVGDDEKAVNTHLKRALKAGVTKGALNQSSGVGARGSFKMGTSPEIPLISYAKSSDTEVRRISSRENALVSEKTSTTDTKARLSRTVTNSSADNVAKKARGAQRTSKTKESAEPRQSSRAEGRKRKGSKTPKTRKATTTKSKSTAASKPKGRTSKAKPKTKKCGSKN